MAFLMKHKTQNLAITKPKNTKISTRQQYFYCFIVCISFFASCSSFSCYQVGKGYEKWWNILFPLIESRESADPSNIVEPWVDNDNQDTDPENYLGGSKNATADNKNECKPKKNKWTIKQSLLTLTK